MDGHYIIIITKGLYQLKADQTGNANHLGMKAIDLEPQEKSPLKFGLKLGRYGGLSLVPMHANKTRPTQQNLVRRKKELRGQHHFYKLI